MRAVDSTLRVTWRQHEGDRIAPDSVVCEIEGPARSLLTAERLSPQEMAGGACIILAGALSGLSRRK